MLFNLSILLLLCRTWSVPTPSDFILSGYLPEYRLYIDVESTIEKINQVNLFSLEIRQDGSINSLMPENELRRIGKIRGDDDKFSTFVTVGGAGRSEGFRTMAKDGALRRRFVKSLGDFVARNNFIRGVDFDWEVGFFYLLMFGDIDVWRC